MRNVDIIKYCNQIVFLSCSALKLKVPEIYYIKQNNQELTLYDQNYKYISSDFRDVRYAVKSIVFVSKEYVIYINTSMLLKPLIYILTLLLRETRYIYQLQQIYNYKNHQPCLESESMIEQWMFAYNLNHIGSQKYVPDSPAELDKNAYAKILMKLLFNIEIRFETDNNFLKDREGELLKEINTYTINEIQKKYQLFKDIAF